LRTKETKICSKKGAIRKTNTLDNE